MAKTIRNVFIIFIVSGFWHGANWTFIIWGGLNALYFLPILLTKNNRNHLNIVAEGRTIPSFKEFGLMMLTFVLTVFAWIFFRAETIEHAINYVSGIFSNSIFSVPYFKDGSLAIPTLILLVFFILIEWFGRQDRYAIASLFMKHRLLKWSLYYLIVVLIFVFAGSNQEFIYFQF